MRRCGVPDPDPPPARKTRPWLTPTLAVGGVFVFLGLASIALESCAVAEGARCEPECSVDSGTTACADFTVDEAYWPTDREGRVTIHYRVNLAVPDGQRVDADDLVAAAAGAAAAWEAAQPQIDFVYDGPTDRRPHREDDVSVIGFGDDDPDAGIASALVHGTGDDAEVDVLLERKGTLYVHSPCEQVDGSCVVDEDYGALLDALPVDDEDEVVELQGVLVHELGHLLGLGHPRAPGETLTMSSNWANDERFPQTLALGDVLGVRALYPCECPTPVVLSP